LNHSTPGTGGTGCSVSGRGTSGMGMSARLQVSRRAAVTAVAVVVTTGSPSAPVCTMDTFQCWVERLVRTGVASTVNGPVVGAPA